ncbi:glucose-1-phosphate adenylyltransferase [Orenia metallireducens]|uniref:Glucose-1-phosphate adenylyltransferase n=1 Tax=Orenia metallireducens TaxID=1413210 RepID=A0A1C0AC93_9FIRM|nr:glucose-1-phosphate adenylyltransferase [Orenia metallireducens]OCL27997.1 glucose-1-phosphate adenylyltransferase [Orenia metallireducens]
MKTLALVLAGGRGTRLDILSEHRAKPSVPFAGKFRLIDFALSNCVNSGIFNVGVLTQYLPLSLNDHIGIGKPWDLDRRIGGVTILQPYTGKQGGWYKGTAHAVYQNLSYIKRNNPKYVIILSGDHVYKMNYDEMIFQHIEKGADLTIATQRVAWEDAHQFGILEPNDNMQIIDFVEKPENPPSNLASMGIYVFTADVLIEKLEAFCDQENSDFGHHIIPEMIDNNKVFAYEYGGYWRDVGTLKALWEANLALTDPLPELNLYDSNWNLHTRSEEKPPVKFGEKGQAIKSLVSNGCIINGVVENSVLSPGVVIEEGAVVRDSVILNNTVVKKNSIVSKCIIDKDTVIGVNSHVGFGNDMTPNDEKPELLDNGLNVIGKEARIPDNTQIGRNCRVLSKVSEDDFEGKHVPSGSTVRSIKGREKADLMGLAR